MYKDLFGKIDDAKSYEIVHKNVTEPYLKVKIESMPDNYYYSIIAIRYLDIHGYVMSLKDENIRKYVNFGFCETIEEINKKIHRSKEFIELIDFCNQNKR